jgi:hypothetical protein
MYRVLTVIATTSMLFVGAPALADNSRSHAASKRAQIADCMTKRMSANKAESYNEAAKRCKDQMNRPNDQLALSTPKKETGISP